MSSHLLLLPPSPSIVSNDSLNAAYNAPITATLKQLSFELRGKSSGVSLDVALPVHFLHDNDDVPRSVLYSATQQLVAGVYKLVCVIAAKEGVNVEDAAGIDVRLILLSYPQSTAEAKAVAFGPITTVEQLAACQRPWLSIITVDGRDGDDLLHQFLTLQDSHVKVRRVPAGSAQTIGSETSVGGGDNTSSVARHTSIAVGGTWDHIHIGHKLLLTMFAFMLEPSGGSLTIGITGDELLVNKKFADVLQDWDDRKDATVRFLKAIMDFRPPPAEQVQLKVLSEPGPNGHAIHVGLGHELVLKCIKISDPFGPTITDRDISALVLSGETRAGGQAVNQKRSEKGWSDLEIFEVDVLDAQEATNEETSNRDNAATAFESKLSSTSIRKALSEKNRIRSKA